jgi:hypothetical protein
LISVGEDNPFPTLKTNSHHYACDAESYLLTPQEEAAGWRLFCNAKTMQGWRSPKAETFPAQGWEIKDGVLTVLASGGS